jgi:hypothetical protein
MIYVRGGSLLWTTPVSMCRSSRTLRRNAEALEPSLATELTRQANDALAAAASKYPDRLLGFATLPMLADPRLSYDADRVTKALLVAEAKAAPDGPKLAALKADERVRVPSGSLRGRTFGDAVSHIDWLADPYSEIRELWAHSDDTVTPAEPHPNALA